MISTKGRYGLRLMLDLATEGGEKPVPVRNCKTTDYQRKIS